MDRLVNAERAAHWYTRAGEPCYEVPYAGKRGAAGEMRPTTIMDARRLHLVPGVTTILRVLAKPGLDAWRREQLVLAALTLPRRDGENLEDFAKRVVQDANDEGAKAAEEGTKIHEAVIAAIEGCEYGGQYKPYVAAYHDWVVSDNLSNPACEVAFACPEYGGRIDLLYDSAVVDIKTVTSKPGTPLARHDEWPLQLVAYAEGAPSTQRRRLKNLVLSRNEPGRWDTADYTDDYTAHHAAWRNAVELWKYLNHWTREE